MCYFYHRTILKWNDFYQVIIWDTKKVSKTKILKEGLKFPIVPLGLRSWIIVYSCFEEVDFRIFQ